MQRLLDQLNFGFALRIVRVVCISLNPTLLQVEWTSLKNSWKEIELTFRQVWLKQLQGIFFIHKIADNPDFSCNNPGNSKGNQGNSFNPVFDS